MLQLSIMFGRLWSTPYFVAPVCHLFFIISLWSHSVCVSRVCMQSLIRYWKYRQTEYINLYICINIAKCVWYYTAIVTRRMHGRITATTIWATFVYTFLIREDYLFHTALLSCKINYKDPIKICMRLFIDDISFRLDTSYEGAVFSWSTEPYLTRYEKRLIQYHS